MDHAAGLLHLGGIGFQVEVQVGQSVVLDVAADVAQRLEFRQGGDRGGAALQEGTLGGAQRLLQPGIRQGAGGILLEGGGVDVLHGVLLSPVM